MGEVAVATEDKYDLEFLRQSIRNCLRARLPSQGCTLADHNAPRTRQKGEKRPSHFAHYEREEMDRQGNVVMVSRRKPAHGQWTSTTHATPTRRSGSSRECIEPVDYLKARQVRAIFTLDPLHILSIRARYAPKGMQREHDRQQLARKVCRQYLDAAVNSRARRIAMAVLQGRDRPTYFCDLFSMTDAQWRRSSHRKMVSVIRRRLGMIDVESLLAWDRRVAEEGA